METEKINKALFDKINFVKRYKELVKRHPCRPEIDLLTMLDFDLTKEILDSFGYKVRYYKSENFFRVLDKRDGYDFGFNIALEQGQAELIWDVSYNKVLVRDVTGIWMGLYETLTGVAWEDVPRYPRYGDYDELEDVLRGSFEIWEDFKKEFLKEAKNVGN